MAEETPQVIYASYVNEGQQARSAAPEVPVFVLKSGMLLEVGNYTYQDVASATNWPAAAAA